MKEDLRKISCEISQEDHDELKILAIRKKEKFGEYVSSILRKHVQSRKGGKVIAEENITAS